MDVLYQMYDRPLHSALSSTSLAGFIDSSKLETCELNKAARHKWIEYLKIPTCSGTSTYKPTVLQLRYNADTARSTCISVSAGEPKLACATANQYLEYFQD